MDINCIVVDLGDTATFSRPEAFEVWGPGMQFIETPSFLVGIDHICGGHLAVALVELNPLSEVESPGLEIV